MKIGYARVSTIDQNLDLQFSALRAAGCKTIFKDHGVSGAYFARDGLDAALRKLRSGDTLVVWRLDRLGRSLSKLVMLINELKMQGVQFVSLSEHIDTTSSQGVLVFHLMAALAEFERNLISERTRAGLAAARARNQPTGRTPILSGDKARAAIELLQTKRIADVASELGVSQSTVNRLIAKHRATVRGRK